MATEPSARAHSEEHGHAHDHTAGASRTSLLIAFALTTGFMLVELLGGVVTQSLALVSDAAHMFTDAAALGIALLAMRMAEKAADRRRTYGYARFEILAAAFNAMLLFGVAVYIVYEAYLRLKAPPDVHATGMLVVAAIGMVVNLVSMRVLANGKDSSLNMKGAYLEVWSDLLGSIGVIVGALLIRFTGYTWIDSVIAVLIGLWVLPRTWALLKASVNILLEGVPEEVKIDKVEEAMRSVPGVQSLHDLHIWAVSSGKTSLTVHLVVDRGVDAATSVLPEVQRRMAETFGIQHVTVQCEHVACGQADQADHFRSATAAAHHASSDSHDRPR